MPSITYTMHYSWASDMRPVRLSWHYTGYIGVIGVHSAILS